MRKGMERRGAPQGHPHRKDPGPELFARGGRQRGRCGWGEGRTELAGPIHGSLLAAYIHVLIHVYRSLPLAMDPTLRISRMPQRPDSVEPTDLSPLTTSGVACMRLRSRGLHCREAEGVQIRACAKMWYLLSTAHIASSLPRSSPHDSHRTG